MALWKHAAVSASVHLSPLCLSSFVSVGRPRTLVVFFDLAVRSLCLFWEVGHPGDRACVLSVFAASCVSGFIDINTPVLYRDRLFRFK